MSYRNNNEPANRNNNIGFRCVGMRTPSLKRGIARAVWIPVHAGVQCPLPGPGPGAPCKRGAKHKPSAPPRGSVFKRSEAWRSGHHRKPRSVPSCLWLVWKVEKFPRSFRFRSETGWRTARSICWSTLPEAPYSSSIAQGTGSASQSHAGDDEGRCEVRLTAGTLSAPGRSPAARPKPWPHTWHYLAYTPLEKKNIIGIGLERPM